MRRIGNYRVTRLLATEAWGHVYEAEERLSKRTVRIEAAHRDAPGSDDEHRRWKSAVAAIARLHHPNLARCLASLEESGELVLVFERIDGPSLRARIDENGPIPWQEAVAIVSAVASAIDAVHRGSDLALHATIDSDHVVSREDGTIAITGLGMASVARTSASFATRDGEALDEPEALGRLLETLLSGRKTASRTSTDSPPPLPAEVRQGLPHGVEALLGQLLDRTSSERPTSAADVLVRLAPFTTAILPPMVLRTRGASGAPPREVSPRVAAAIIVGLSLLAGLITYAWRVNEAGFEADPARDDVAPKR